MRLRALALSPLALAALALAPLRGDEPRPLEKGHAEVAAPFLEKHCLRCHGEKDPEGDIVLAGLRDWRTATDKRAVWRRVSRQVSTRQMPPDDEPQPDEKERAGFLAWVKQALSELPAPPVDPGRVTVRRLNRAEWAYTVQDLLHVALRAEDELPADDTGYGFDRIGDVLSMPPLLLEKYLGAAEQVATQAILDWKPLKARVAGLELALHGTSGGDAGSFKVLYSNGRAETTVKVAWTGDYVLRARAYADQAGSESAKMALVVDGEHVANFEVAATSAKPKVYEKKVHLEAGERKLGAAFLNDYYKPDDPDPKNRDRNLAVEFLELDGPAERPALPWAHAKWFAKSPAPALLASGKTFASHARARRAFAKTELAPVAEAAWRRPAKADELERLSTVVEKTLAEGESWDRGLQLALEAILVSPSFLFRLELEALPTGEDRATGGSTAVTVELLDERTLATRLSYFIWSSLPDEALLAAARQGTLRKDLEKETRRLLADPKASRLTSQFAVQWLQLRRLESFVPDKATFPSWDPALAASARAETEALFEAVLSENRSVRDLIDCDFTYVDERLARHYGIEDVRGSAMRRVPAPDARRGLLGQASVLMATSNPTRTSPVKRGRWVLDVLLDDPPPPPLPGADSLKDAETKTAKNLRERLEQHRARKECASCHARMDGIGFALEKFDAIGARRDEDQDGAIDDRGTLQDGTKVAGVAGLRAWLEKRTPRVARAIAKKLLVFALGRGPIAADEEALDVVIERCAPDYKLQDLIVELVKLDAFQKRRVAGKGKTWH